MKDMKNILLEIDENTKVISDTHFNHKGVLEFEPYRLEHMKRQGYDTSGSSEELNELHTEWLIKNWNYSVQDDDIILVLGDVAWKGHRSIMPRLKGRKILILGNHDKTGPNVYSDDFEYIVRGHVQVQDDRIYICESEDKLMSSLDIIIQNERYLISHYPTTIEEFRYKIIDGVEVEDASNKRIRELIKIVEYREPTYSLHGHTHSNCMSPIYDYTNELSFLNASVENIGFKPVTIAELRDEI